MNEDDKRLEEFLEGDSELEKVYRAGASEKVSPELHAKIVSGFRNSGVPPKESVTEKPRRHLPSRGFLGLTGEFALPSWGLLSGGLVLGVLVATLYAGYQSTGSNILTAGLDRLFGRSNTVSLAPTLETLDSNNPLRSTFDFFTVLPDERVIPETAADETLSKENVVKDKKTSGYYYMLQVASYTEEAKADQLKEKLVKIGFASSIQHISVQGQSDFYRVRIGPFFSMPELEQVNRQLTRKGIEALPLKVTRP